jgi:hypothetical protein
MVYSRVRSTFLSFAFACAASFSRSTPSVSVHLSMDGVAILGLLSLGYGLATKLRPGPLCDPPHAACTSSGPSLLAQGSTL